MKNNHIDISILEQYLDGSLSEKEMYQIELIAQEDAFLDEAIAGLKSVNKPSLSVSLLQKRLQQRVDEKPILKKKWAITSQRLSIAATAGVLFLAASFLYWMKLNYQKEQLKNNKEAVEVEIDNTTPVTVAIPPMANDSQKPEIVEQKIVTPKANSSNSSKYQQNVGQLAPEPKEGWLKFNDYIEKNNQFITDGERMVELGFTIAEDGTPTAVEILNGQSEKLNQEAIRLLTAGPKWNYIKNSKNKATLIVKF